MRKTLPILAAALLVIATSVSAEEARRTRRAPRGTQTATTFAATVEYTGQLKGSVVLADRVCRIAPTANLYEIGRGGLTPDDFVAGRMIFVTGYETAEGPVITQVVVRPVRNVALMRVNQEVFIKSRPINTEGR